MARIGLCWTSNRESVAVAGSSVLGGTKASSSTGASQLPWATRVRSRDRWCRPLTESESVRLLRQDKPSCNARARGASVTCLVLVLYGFVFASLAFPCILYFATSGVRPAWH